MGSETLSRSPDEMVNFNLLTPASASILTPRVGTLVLAGRKTISTPHFIPLSSRGVIPHVTHDMLQNHTSISSAYLALEDFIERQEQPKKAKGALPAYSVPRAPHESALRKFTCLPDDLLLVLGARREPPIACPPPNTSNSIAILTSVGFRQLDGNEYVEAIQKLNPDIVVGLADLVIGQPPGVKRRPKMVDRTHAYTTHATDNLYGTDVSEESRSKTAYFAPVLPLDNAEQTIYLDDLETDLRPLISGLALYDSASLSIIPESIGDLPRLLFSGPATPHSILREVSLGADLLTIPFLGLASDSGLTLDFVFPPPETTSSEQPLPLAFDLWSSSHAIDTSPLHPSCPCYTCQKHHRAYIHHLLNAKEMLAWTLLQVHNHQVMENFFAQIRQSIQRGTFDADVESFTRIYAPELPAATGQGPRLRGYQLPAPGASQPRRYPPAYGRLDLTVEKFAESQSSIATPDTGAEVLEERGFAEKTA